MTKQEQKDAAWEAYIAFRAPALEAYKAIQASTWEAYIAFRAPALEAYKAIEEPAWEAYKAIKVQAWKAYEAELKRIDSEPDEDIIEKDSKRYQLVK